MVYEVREALETLYTFASTLLLLLKVGFLAAIVRSGWAVVVFLGCVILTLEL